MSASLILAIVSLIFEKGVPDYLEWKDGVKLENPTLKDIEALKVVKMSDKITGK
jgi:hypothetical protein|tara:strand:- start:301 stop:462 length:162 start_codon:yes stop_codon:yes gene_type:complete